MHRFVCTESNEGRRLLSTLETIQLILSFGKFTITLIKLIVDMLKNGPFCPINDLSSFPCKGIRFIFLSLLTVYYIFEQKYISFCGRIVVTKQKGEQYGD
jgi:hypothetical protein